MKVVVSGGAGFLGSHLCEYLLKKGNAVTAVDNLITGSKANISHLPGIYGKKFSFIKHDICVPLAISGPVDRIYDLASPASPIDYLELPIETLKVGSFGTYNMLELARKKKARLLLASTSEVYGDPLINPQVEEYWGNVNPVGPRSVYDEAKRFSEALVMAYHRKYSLATRIVRIFNTYGPRMRLNDGRVIPNFVYQALKDLPMTVYGKGRQTRSFCYVSDLIEGIVRLMESACVTPVNIGNPLELKILDMAKKIKAYTGSKSRIEYMALPEDDPKLRKPDITKAEKLLKWQPVVSLDEGLDRTISWFKGRIS